MSTPFPTEPHHPLTRAEQVAEHGLEAGRTGRRLARNTPFLIVSIGLHLVLFLLLAYVTAQRPVEQRRLDALRVEDTVEVPEEVPPMRREVFAAQASTTVLGGVGPAASENFESAVKGTAQAAIGRPDILGLRVVSEGKASDFEALAGSKFAIIGGKSDKTPEGAVDQFAIATLNSMARGRTLVALLIDQSRSIVYGDLPRIIERMDRYFDEIGKNLPMDLSARGRWVVVSYGRSYRFICEPTSDLDLLKKALRSVEVDPSGEENVGVAVDAVLKRFGNSGYQNFLIAAMTDEAGDDIDNPAILERLIVNLRAANARFYVFGYESSFCCRKKQIAFKLDPDVVRGADRAAIRGFEGQTIYGWADGGPESPRPELWWGANWHNWSHWGGGINNLPSGFGMYALNRLVLSSHGVYFLLRPESRYDEDKLYARYKPDICSVLQYEERVAVEPLRRELAAVWREIGTFYMPGDLRANPQVEEALARSLSGRDYCIARAAQIKNLVEHSAPSGYNWSRWEAHADLTMAELLRFRFMLGQYNERLRTTWLRNGRTMPVGKRVLMVRGKVPDDYMGPAQAKHEYDLAVQYTERVINKHKGTPWETAAQRIKGSVFPWQCQVADLPGPGGPQPPQLAF